MCLYRAAAGEVGSARRVNFVWIQILHGFLKNSMAAVREYGFLKNSMAAMREYD